MLGAILHGLQPASTTLPPPTSGPVRYPDGPAVVPAPLSGPPGKDADPPPLTSFGRDAALLRAGPLAHVATSRGDSGSAPLCAVWPSVPGLVLPRPAASWAPDAAAPPPPPSAARYPAPAAFFPALTPRPAEATAPPPVPATARPSPAPLFPTPAQPQRADVVVVAEAPPAHVVRAFFPPASLPPPVVSRGLDGPPAGYGRAEVQAYPLAPFPLRREAAPPFSVVEATGDGPKMRIKDGEILGWFQDIVSEDRLREAREKVERTERRRRQNELAIRAALDYLALED